MRGTDSRIARMHADFPSVQIRSIRKSASNPEKTLVIDLRERRRRGVSL